MQHRVSCHLSLFPVVLLLTFPLAGVQSGRRVTINEAETTQAWEALNRKDYRGAIEHAEGVIGKFDSEATQQQAELTKDGVPRPPVGKPRDEKSKQAVFARGVLNDVASCYFIKGEALEKAGRTTEAKRSYEAGCKLTYARTWDPGGWFWDPSAESCQRASKIK